MNMASVTIEPLPPAYRAIPERLRPAHKPIFDGPATEQDVELARALFAELDPESKRWYSGCDIFKDLI
jgi:hypothetical protein